MVHLNCICCCYSDFCCYTFNYYWWYLETSVLMLCLELMLCLSSADFVPVWCWCLSDVVFAVCCVFKHLCCCHLLNCNCCCYSNFCCNTFNYYWCYLETSVLMLCLVLRLCLSGADVCLVSSLLSVVCLKSYVAVICWIAIVDGTVIFVATLLIIINVI